MYGFQLLALVRRCRLARVLCVIDGLLEVGGELVLAVLLDGHEGWVLRTLLLRYYSYEVGVHSVGVVFLDVVASPECRRSEALYCPEEGGFPHEDLALAEDCGHARVPLAHGMS